MEKTVEKPHGAGLKAFDGFRYAIAREGPLARTAIAAFFVAAVIYGGGKGDGGNGGGDGGDAGGGDRGNGSLTPTGAATTPGGNGMPRDFSSNGAFAVSNLCFTAMAIVSNNMVAFAAAWPENFLPCPATLDFFVKTNLMDCAWNWLFAETVLPGTSNLTASVSLSAIADGTNAPPSAFFHFRHREADCQTMRDFDGDGIPDIYELHNGTNPYMADAALAPRLTVGANDAYANIPNALAASTNYSIISLAPETFTMHQPIEMPMHPVMLVSENGRATIDSDADIGAFMFDKGNDCRTLVKGIDIILGARSSFQAAFWCGGNLPWSGFAAVPSFEDVRIRAPYPEPLYYGWHFYRTTNNAVSIRNCTINAAGASYMHGIYSYDGPPLEIANCSFVNFPPDHAGVFVQATTGYHCGLSNTPAVSVSGCAFDDSFTNAIPLARLGSATNAANCFVAMRDCIVPSPLEPQHAPDFAGNVCVTNSGLPWNGLALPGFAAFDFGIGDIRDTDFSSTADADGDGLSDYDEAFVHETDPWLADSDGDGQTDGAEIVQSTDPKNFYSCFRRITAISRRPAYASSITNYLGYGSETNAWTTNVWTSIADAVFTNVFEFATTGKALFFVEFCDIDRDGAYDEETDLAVLRAIPPLATAQTLTFDFTANLDADRDGMPDLWERIHAGAGLSSTNAADAMLDFDGDGLLNLHEYWVCSNPLAYDGTNTALYAVIHSIDDRLTTTNSAGRMRYYTTASPSAIIVNTNCWAADIPLGSQSPYNSSGGLRKSGTLVSDRHIFFAKHFQIGVGSKIYFHGNDGSMITNTLLDSAPAFSDIHVGLLANAIDTNLVPVASILPADYPEYIGTGKGIPALAMNQWDDCLVMDLQGMSDSVLVLRYENGPRSAFSRKIAVGDSGNPVYLIIGNCPVFLFEMYGAAGGGNQTNGYNGVSGPSLSRHAEDIQQTMDSLSLLHSLPERAISRFDFSGYFVLPKEE